ncbi:UNKNOWN [Stylonychia lemnae]|uniref:Transmembrane protein n=1 Tax=Stylonychia lemnae TaxID=5949 RepID=A0A077ZUM7_STYLE|nr:UNKNOWN [Stylonychia lemnae]|eukprot:CDW73010.1 UNKNOWN [Stylonychia lemnae]
MPQENESIDITNIQESDGDLVFGGSVTKSGIKSPLLGYYDQDIYYPRLKWMFSILARSSDAEFNRIQNIYIKNGNSFVTMKSDSKDFLAVIKIDNSAMQVVSSAAIPEDKQGQGYHQLTVDEEGFVYIYAYNAEQEQSSIIRITMDQAGTSWQTQLNYPAVLSFLITITSQSQILATGIIYNPEVANAIISFKLTQRGGYDTKVSVVSYNEAQNSILMCYEKQQIPYFSGFIYTNLGDSQTQSAHYDTIEFLNYLEVIYHNGIYKLLVKIISQEQATEKYVFFSFYEVGIKSTYSFSIIYSDYDDQQCGAFITLEDTADFIISPMEQILEAQTSLSSFSSIFTEGTILRILLILTMTLAIISFYQKILQNSNKCLYALTLTNF